MRQYTVNIRCMYDVTEGEINDLYVCSCFVVLLWPDWEVLRHFVGLLFQIGVPFKIHCLLQHSIHVLYT